MRFCRFVLKGAKLAQRREVKRTRNEGIKVTFDLGIFFGSILIEPLIEAIETEAARKGDRHLHDKKR